jgi:hypothetical protein
MASNKLPYTKLTSEQAPTVVTVDNKGFIPSVGSATVVLVHFTPNST